VYGVVRFGQYVRARREMRGLSLRQLCEIIDFDPGNWSKVERGVFPPPDSNELLRSCGAAIGLQSGSQELVAFLDLAAAGRGQIPKDLLADEALVRTLPQFFRTLRAEKSAFEEDSKDRFLAYLREERGELYITSDVDVEVQQRTGHNFDFELTPLRTNRGKIALEIFRLVESESRMAEQSHRNSIWEALKQELSHRNIKDYVVQTPWHTQLAKADVRAFCVRIAESIRRIAQEHPTAEEFQIEGFTVRRHEGLGTVVFTSHAGGAFISPWTMASDALESTLPEKDLQLAIEGYERILLAVNWSPFVRSADLVSALAGMDLSAMRNTDRIYFEAAPGHFDLVYDRSVKALLESASNPPQNPLGADLYHRWLEARILQKDSASYEVVRSISFRRGGVDWIRSVSAREGFIWMVVDRVEAGAIDDGLWALKAFERDPDPRLNNSPDDPGGKFNVHERVLRGDRVISISSVRGAVCWLAQKLCVRVDVKRYPEIMETLERLAFDPNLYVRTQVTVPLVEMARMRWQKNKDGQFAMDVRSRQRVRNLALAMLDANNPYPRVLEWLAKVFHWLPDLSVGEAKDLLGILLGNCDEEARQDLARLIIYFAIHRELQEKLLGPFDASYFKDLLSRVLVDGDDYLRASLVWVIAAQLEEAADNFRNYLPFLARIPDGNYNSAVYNHLRRIVKKFRGVHPEILNEIWARAQAKGEIADPVWFGWDSIIDQ
jgi:transcriptional regulator with XRE-family HTH domain